MDSIKQEFIKSTPIRVAAAKLGISRQRVRRAYVEFGYLKPKQRPPGAYAALEAEYKRQNGHPLCACGCSMPIRFKRGKPMRWISGHQGKNAPITLEVSSKRSRAAKANWQKNGSYLAECLRSAQKGKNWRDRLRASFSTPQMRQKLRDNALVCWADPEYRKRNVAATSLAVKSESYRELQRQISRAKWKNPEYRQKMIAARSKANGKSRLEDIVASMLDELKIPYLRQHSIGYWLFDFFIPSLSLLVEINGDYWHNRKQNAANDTRKYAYVAEYFPHLKLRIIWEHEFASPGALQDKILRLLGLKEYEQADFSFDDIEIKPCALRDVDLFLTKYHYLRGIGFNSCAYGAYLQDRLIAVCSFASITRRASAADAESSPKFVKELNRFCIHPSYHKKNFGSWFLSRCLKLLRRDAAHIDSVITFSDSTAGHDGSLYTASGFRFVSDVAPSYWYMDGIYVVHKKTVWDNAKKLRMSEDEYALKYDLKKVAGMAKKKFLCKL